LIRTDEMKRHIVSAAKGRAPKVSPKLI